MQRGYLGHRFLLSALAGISGGLAYLSYSVTDGLAKESSQTAVPISAKCSFWDAYGMHRQ
jgi:hypothetical protein